MDGKVDDAKLAEAQQWLFHRVQLVRGKYKGRNAHVVGMTAKKYRVRVTGVEHQLEFYPSMFKNPVPAEADALEMPPKGGTPTGAAQEDGHIDISISNRSEASRKSFEGSTNEGEGSSCGIVQECKIRSDASQSSSASAGTAGTCVVSTKVGAVESTCKTREELIQLMEETRAEMTRAKCMMAAMHNTVHIASL